MTDQTASAKAKDENKVEEKKSGKNQVDDPSFNMDELQALAALVNEHGFTDFEFENENIRVRLSKAVQVAAAPAQAAVAATIAPQAEPAATQAAEPVDPDAALHKITSPIVGTFYRSPGPDKDAYVSEGSNVSADTTVCIVEAMKLMNEIQAEVSGEIVKIYVENGQPVEYGQALFGVRK
ncbi:MAG: acetyl-CoA carboxylase biotin carboxyl carrier protein [Pyrinomonadaceae bacterium]|nr:acetyl-CoA carboxylase biotin carboxyl carrier protein [Pyrinomonadaceae bacterium]MBP9108329.1 acetyl-CoA carboxylase biotin carboxyl carrier protein [Pyrinomonadaceae bacterium]